jgi:hypothetical protein
MTETVVQPHKHTHDDLRIIEVSSGTDITENEQELQYYVDHTEEAKRKLILICKKCLESHNERFPDIGRV